MKNLSYPNRIVLRAPLWQRLIFPILIPCIIYWVASDVSLQTDNGYTDYTTGATIALVIFASLEIFFLLRFFLDGTLTVDPEGISFAKLGKKHHYKWDEIDSVYCMNSGGFFLYINGLCLKNKKIVMFMEYYGFFDGEKLGNLLESYHKAALEAQGGTKQE